MRCLAAAPGRGLPDAINSGARGAGAGVAEGLGDAGGALDRRGRWTGVAGRGGGIGT